MIFETTTLENAIPLLILLVITLLAIRSFVWTKIKNLMAQGWPSNQGTIEFGSVEERRTRYFTYYVARVDYSYSVNGEYFSGYLQKLFFTGKSAENFVAAMKGKPVFVRAQASSPGRSALLQRDQPGGWPI